jgi:hypothetical protein
VTFTATFEVVLNAKERHDIGIYFVTDGDPNGDGAVSGDCSISILPYEPDESVNYLDLDGTTDPWPGTNDISGVQDTCGDIDKPEHSPLYPEITLTAMCVDHDSDGYLNLPNGTSWRQSGANELCTEPLNAFPGSPSKCSSDKGFNMPIEVPPAKLLVTKTANPTSVNEPGGLVTYKVSVSNIGIDPNNFVTLKSLSDDIYGDFTQVQGDIQTSTCSVGQIIPADDANPGGIDTYECQFTAKVSGNALDEVKDIVTATATDSRGNVISGDAEATVTIEDVLPEISIVKTASPTEVLEPSGQVTFTVVVSNNSVSSDPVTISSLTDDIYGDLNGQGDCSVPQTIAAGDSYTCSFTADVTGNAGTSHTDVVTASGQDDDGNNVGVSASATVNVNDVPSSITLTKTASPTSVDEPGGNVTFTFVVYNTSAVDTVTIDSMKDTIFGDLTLVSDSTCSVPQTITAGGTYTCSFIAYVAGNASDSETNVATISGSDDDGNPISASDDATVNVNNLPPAATLTKSVTEAVVTYKVVVSNDSDIESLELTALDDDKFGDITQVQGAIQGTDCSVPQTLLPKGESGDTYSCTFDAKVRTSPHTDTVTGTVSDDDSDVPIKPSDSATVTFE